MVTFNKVYNKLIAIILLLLVLYGNIFLVSSIYDINNNISNYKYQNNLSKTGLSHKEICKIFKCKSIRHIDKIEFYDKNNFVYSSEINSNNTHLINEYHIDFSTFSFNIKTGFATYTYINILENKDKFLAIIILSLPLLIMIFGIIITSVIHEEQKEGAVRTAGNEALLTNKSMIMITENIHHEMNTPLEVIDNKIQKIKMKMKKLDPLKLVQIEDDFEFIDTSSAQIRNILEKMKTFKNLRYSKKNQNIHKIFSNVFKMISMSSTNFEFSISDELKSVTINEDALTSSDLLNIGINHVKNSLEGGASKVYIIFEKIENDNLYIRIIDNGNGIAKNNQKKIFNPNFSTKSDFEGLRGNGMYLNKQIMNNAGGDIKLISSTKKGTTIGLNFHIKKQGVKNG